MCLILQITKIVLLLLQYSSSDHLVKLYRKKYTFLLLQEIDLFERVARMDIL